MRKVKVPFSKYKFLFIIPFVFIFSLLFAFAYKSMLKIFESETSIKNSEVIEAEDLEKENVNLTLRFNSFDPLKGDLYFYINFNYEGENPGSTKPRNIRLHLKNSATRQDILLPKSTNYSDSPEFKIQTDSGFFLKYPFDEYEARLEGYIYDPEVYEDTKDFSKSKLPVSLSFKSFIPLFEIKSIKKTNRDEPKDIRIDFIITRTKSSVIFSITMMILAGLVSLVMITILFSTIFSERKTEIGAFLFMASMILVLPALRSFQPGSPPLGAYPDFLVFFWAEGIAVISLIILASSWFLRKIQEKVP